MGFCEIFGIRFGKCCRTTHGRDIHQHWLGFLLKKKESNKNLPLDPCLTFFQNFVQMNALRMLKASKKSVEQTIITLGYVLPLYDNIIANG